jgi:hypothetical protein
LLAKYILALGVLTTNGYDDCTKLGYRLMEERPAVVNTGLGLSNNIVTITGRMHALLRIGGNPRFKDIIAFV